MIYTSPLLSQASGSIGGSTFSHNKGGAYLRRRNLVITPKTPQQLAMQNTMRTLTARWKTLSDAQRAAWKTFALNVPRLNALGQSRVIPELATYVSLNSYRLSFIGPTSIVDDAPTVFGTGTLTTPVLTATAPGTLSVAYTNTDEWATTTGGHLLIFQGRPVSATRLFPKTNYRFAGSVAGDTTTPPTSPDVPTAQFTFAAGDRIYLRAVASLADGRASSPQIVSAIAV